MSSIHAPASEMPTLAFLCLLGSPSITMNNAAVVCRGEIYGLPFVETPSDPGQDQDTLKALGLLLYTLANDLTVSTMNREQPPREFRRKIEPWGPGRIPTRCIIYMLPHAVLRQTLSKAGCYTLDLKHVPEHMQKDFTLVDLPENVHSPELTHRGIRHSPLELVPA